MKLFVWDFHGTLEKGNEYAVLEISNLVLEKYKYKERFDKEESERLYGLKWYEYFQYKLPYENLERCIELQEECFEISNDQPKISTKHMKVNDHVHEVLKEIKKKHEQVLISNTKPYSLRMFAEAIGVREMFGDENILAVDGHKPDWNKTKRKLLRHYLRGKKFEDIIVIGDSKKDIDLANYFNGRSYLYAHPGKKFKEAEADFKIRDLRKILKEI